MKLLATGNRLTLTSPDRLVSGSINIYTCEFTFDDSWAGYMPTAVFECGGKAIEMAVIDNVCQVPFELLTPNSRIRVGIYGISGDKRRPTTYAEWMPVERGTETGGAAQTPPDPNVYESILAAITDGRLVGPPGPEGPPGPAGPDGYSPTVALTETESGVRVSVQNKDNVQSATVLNGKDGAPGQDGVGIQSVTQTTTSTEDSGTNIVTVTKTDGTTSTFEVRNGGGGTADHAKLKNRDAADQHPMSAITGLVDALEGKLPASELPAAINTALAQAKASGEFDGKDGSPGADGKDGVGIQSVTQTTTSTEDGGANIVTVTKTDGTTSTFEFRNGSRGSIGPAGADGKDGSQGPAGADGKTAYQYAQEGGYTGTEAEFAEKMAAEIPEAYSLPIASPTVLGGVQPVAKTDAMTQSVGVDETGGLWAQPGSGGAYEGIYSLIVEHTIAEDVSEVVYTNEEYPGIANLKHILVSIIFPERQTTNWWKVVADNVAIISGNSVSNVKHYYGIADVKCGNWIYSSGGNSNGNASQYLPSPSVVFSPKTGYEQTVYNDYSSLRIYGNSFTFTAGTVVRIWGCG